MEQIIDVPQQEINTKDNATVRVDGVACYQVLDVRRASYEIANLQQALLNLVVPDTSAPAHGAEAGRPPQDN